MKIFEILNKMNEEDTINNTRLVGISNHLISGVKTKQGSKITMGADDQALIDILSGKSIPLLVLVDKNEYLKRKSSNMEPSNDK